MPANVKDHDLWKKAKKQATDEYGHEKPSKDSFYAIVNKIYQNMGGTFADVETAMRRYDEDQAMRIVQDNSRTRNEAKRLIRLVSSTLVPEYKEAGSAYTRDFVAALQTMQGLVAGKTPEQMSKLLQRTYKGMDVEQFAERHLIDTVGKAAEESGKEQTAKDFYDCAYVILALLGKDVPRRYIREDERADMLETAALRIADFTVTSGTLNNPDYAFYVFSTKKGKIISGWEFREDAQDDMLNNYESSFARDLGLKVLSKSAIKRMSVNPEDDNAWFQGTLDSSGEPDEPAVDEMLFRQNWES